MSNLFGDFGEQPQNECGAKAPKKSKTTGSTAAKKGLEEKLPVRQMQVKMYSDFYEYEAPDDLQEPTLDDVRKWLLNNHGFTELADSKRVGMFVVNSEVEGEAPYVYCGVKFEKMG